MGLGRFEVALRPSVDGQTSTPVTGVTTAAGEPVRDGGRAGAGGTGALGPGADRGRGGPAGAGGDRRRDAGRPGRVLPEAADMRSQGVAIGVAVASSTDGRSGLARRRFWAKFSRGTLVSTTLLSRNFRSGGYVTAARLDALAGSLERAGLGGPARRGQAAARDRRATGAAALCGPGRSEPLGGAAAGARAAGAGAGAGDACSGALAGCGRDRRGWSTTSIPPDSGSWLATGRRRRTSHRASATCGMC